VTKSKQRAQERARQVRAAQLAAQARRRRMRIAGAAIGVVVLVLGILIAVKLASGGSKPTASTATAGPAPSAVSAALASVPASVLDQIGAGKVNSAPVLISDQPVLTDSGKPLVVYLGAEYCPFCAGERWAMVVALNRFGSFTNLGVTHSSSTDVYPDTPTLTFHGATYTSQYLTFQGVEMQSNQPQGNGYAPLDSPTQLQQQLLSKFDAPPYVPSDSAGSIPFIDFANQAVMTGASYSPELLAGKTAEQIAQALSDPSSAIAQAVDGTANAFTALICQLTNSQPGPVCGSDAVTAYQGKFHAAG
jgi:hypothetical protein